jgi:phospholipase/carboxylesterase
MFKNKTVITILIIVVFTTAMQALALPASDDEKPVTDWSRIASIDPLRDDIGDFLTIDLFKFQVRALEAARDGDYLNAARYYLFILHHRYDSPDMLYNLACSYASMKRPDLAGKYLLYAIRAGFSDIQHFLKDTDFDPVRGENDFDTVEKKVKEFGENIGEPVLLKTTKVLNGRLHLPEKYDPARSYPLVIALHGRGDWAENFAAIWRNIERKEFILLVPEAPYEMKDAGLYGPAYSWFYLVRDKKTWGFADPLTAENIISAAEQISAKYKTGNVYLLGFSQGVSAAYLTAYRRPDMFKGLIAFAGRLPGEEFLPAANSEAFKRIKLFIAHGTSDESVTEKDTNDMKLRLDAKGCMYKYYEFEGGHFVDPETLNKIIEIILNEDINK